MTDELFDHTTYSDLDNADRFAVNQPGMPGAKNMTWAALKVKLATLFAPKNTAITGATKTKITYDANGLVTDGADATTADITDSANKRYVTDAKLAVLNNTSGTNTGDQDVSGFVDKTTTQIIDGLKTFIGGIIVKLTSATAFVVQNVSSVSVFTVNTSTPSTETVGTATVKKSSTTALRVQNDSGTNVLIIDTINGRMGVNTIPTAPLDIVAIAQLGVGEVLAKLSISDSTSYLSFENGTSANGNYYPVLKTYIESSAYPALLQTCYILPTADSGSLPIVNFNIRRSDNSLITTRPLFQWTNFGTSFMQMLASGFVGIGNALTPTEKFHVDGNILGTGSVRTATARIGTASNYVDIASDGHLTLAGTATVFDDLLPTTFSATTGGSAPNITLIGASTILKAQEFANSSATEEKLPIWQLPHRWKNGSNVYPHIHLYVPNDATGGVISFSMTYMWSNIGDTTATETTVTGTITRTANQGISSNIILDFTAIVGTGKTESSIFTAKISRVQGGADTFSGTCWLLSTDIHIEIEKFGANTLP
jgi:hypothetical protein